MSAPAVSIIIPTRTPALLHECVERLQQNISTLHRQIIVVDTGDGNAADWAQGHACSVLTMQGATFAKAVNQAAIAAQGEYLLLLNDDVLVDSTLDWRMYGVARLNGGHTIVGARLLYPNGLIQHAGVGFDIDGNPYHLWHGAPAGHSDAMKRRWLPAVTFACALIPRRMWATLGGLCEDYQNGYEDLDFCLRAREIGYSVLYDYRTSAVHLTAQTAGRFAHEAENKRLFVERWVLSGRLSWVLGCWPFTVGGG